MAKKSINGDEIVCTSRDVCPPSHLRIAYSPRATNEFKSKRQYRSHWDTCESGIYEWLVASPHIHETSYRTHWALQVLWALWALQYFRSFFVCRLSIPIYLSLTLALCAAILNSLRTNTCENSTHTHLNESFCSYWSVYICNPSVTHTIRTFTHTDTHGHSKRSSPFSCQKQT